MKRKKELIVILSSLLVIVLSVSVAYFTTKILGEGKEISVESADLKVIFTSGSGTINGTNIEPGWSSGENTFTVKNESNGTYDYNIVIKDLVNTFVSEGFLQYKITSADGGYNMTDFVDVPKSSTAKDVTISSTVSIAKGVTHTYKVEFKYLKSDDVDQSADMGKTLIGKMFIEEVERFKGGTLSEAIMYNNPVISTRTSFNETFYDNTLGTLYKSTENGTTVYYFAGADVPDEGIPINNWVKFGKYKSDLIMYRGYYSETDTSSYSVYSTMEECTSASSDNYNCTEIKYASAGDPIYWRIIRTNSDGSIRLLYSGTSPNTITGYIGISAFNTFETRSKKYVGYMYGDDDSTLDGIRTNTNDSTVKSYIDNWYENNLTTYTNYLSNDAIYCNDRELASGESYLNGADFKSYERLDYDNRGRNSSPTYDCSNSKDAFSGNNTEAKLKYPIALMTADEAVYAGAVAGNGVSNTVLWYMFNPNGIEDLTITDYDWWLMTPSSKFYVWNIIYTYGGLKWNWGTNDYVSRAIRPVTSLKSCVQWKSGDGSANSPYEIVENGGC